MNSSLQSGFALIIVIWVTSLLTLMGASFSLSMRRETTNLSIVKDYAKALAAAGSGIEIAQKMLLLTDKKQRWRANGTIYSIHLPNAEVRVRLFAEQGKIDLNQVTEELLTKLIRMTGLTNDRQQALVNAILDWRDTDNLIRIDGAEKQQYINAGLNYLPSNKPFKTLEELRLVLGMNEEIYQQILPLTTIYSGRSQVNLALAPQEVLQILSSPDDLDHNLSTRPVQKMPLPTSAASIFPTAKQINQVYSIISQARINNQVSTAVQIIFKRVSGNQQSPFQTLVWKMDYPGVDLFSQAMESLLYREDSSKTNNP